MCATTVTLVVVRNGGRIRLLVVVARVLGLSLLGPMTTTDILSQLRNDFARYGRTPHSEAVAAAFRDRHPALALDGVRDLCDLVAALDTGGGRSVLERAAIVEGLLVDAEDEALRRTLLQTLLPGVVGVCRKLRFGQGIIAEPSEVLLSALSLLSELLVDWAGEERPYAAPDILSALRGRLRRWLLNEKRALAATRCDLRESDAQVTESSLVARLESFRGSSYERLAQLTFARVFEGRSLRELAARDHSHPASLQREMQHFASRFLL